MPLCPDKIEIENERKGKKEPHGAQFGTERLQFMAEKFLDAVSRL